MPTVAEKQTRN